MLAWKRTACTYQIVLRLSRYELLCNRFTAMLHFRYSFARIFHPLKNKHEAAVESWARESVMCSRINTQADTTNPLNRGYEWVKRCTFFSRRKSKRLVARVLCYFSSDYQHMSSPTLACHELRLMSYRMNIFVAKFILPFISHRIIREMEIMTER